MNKIIISSVLVIVLLTCNRVNAQSFIKIRPDEDKVICTYHYANGVMSGMSLHEYFQNTGETGSVIVSSAKSGKVTVNVSSGMILRCMIAFNTTSVRCASSDYTDIQINLSSASGTQSFTESLSPYYTQGTSIWIPTPAPGHFINTSGYWNKVQIDTCYSLDVGQWTSLSLIQLPKSVSLQNYPNPFEKSTIISFNLSSKSFVTLDIFNLLGRKVTTLVSEELPSGNHSYQWNAENLFCGVYLCRLHVGSIIETKKLVVSR